jgi:hypothetical protein
MKMLQVLLRWMWMNLHSNPQVTHLTLALTEAPPSCAADLTHEEHLLEPQKLAVSVLVIWLSELPMLLKRLAEDPLSDLWSNFQQGSELPTHTESVRKLSAQVYVLHLSWVVRISIKHFDIFKLSIHIPLNSTVFPILKFKIEINKKSSFKLQHCL